MSTLGVGGGRGGGGGRRYHSVPDRLGISKSWSSHLLLISIHFCVFCHSFPSEQRNLRSKFVN